MTFQKEFGKKDNNASSSFSKCSFCDMDILDSSFAVRLKNCNHVLHRTCLDKNFETIPDDPESEKLLNKCRTCKKPILEGFEIALQQPKVLPNKT